jgi:hypothetical protein
MELSIKGLQLRQGWAVPPLMRESMCRDTSRRHVHGAVCDVGLPGERDSRQPLRPQLTAHSLDLAPPALLPHPMHATPATHPPTPLPPPPLTSTSSHLNPPHVISPIPCLAPTLQDLKVSPWARVAITRAVAIAPTLAVALLCGSGSCSGSGSGVRLDQLNQVTSKGRVARLVRPLHDCGRTPHGLTRPQAQP